MFGNLNKMFGNLVVDAQVHARFLDDAHVSHHCDSELWKRGSVEYEYRLLIQKKIYFFKKRQWCI